MTTAVSTLNLIFRTGAHVCALPVSKLVETLRPVPVKPLAGVPAAVRGVAIVRGAPVPVLDLAALLGGEGSCSRFVIVRTGEEHRIALAVDEVLGIRSIDPTLWSELPPLLRDACPGVVESIGTLDREALLVLGTGALVPDGVWESIARQEA